MNEDKELEEAIKTYNELKKYKEVIKNIDTNFFFKFAETVLQALEYKDKTINKIKEESKIWLETSKAEMQEYGDNHEKYWKMFYELLNKIIKL